MDGSAALAGVSAQRDLSAPSPSLLDADASADLATSGEPSTVVSPQQATAPKAGAASVLADPSRHAQPSRRMRVLSKKERVSGGRNYPMQGVVQSPLSRIGIPAAAVPAVATVISVGAAALWPLLLKTLGMLLKAVIGGRLRVWAKKDKKLDTKQRQFVMFGFQVRPWELGSMLLGASVYGLGISYALKGWKLDSSFVLREEAMVLLLYYLRGFIRLGFERMFGLVTQYQFWPSGGVLCLCSAYLGNTLATTGYELESIGGTQTTAKANLLKVVLLLSALCLSLAFFAANLVFPNPVLQSGRVITSGIALAEILPIAPMPGLKIYQWRRGFWGVLFLLVVPTYFLINFFL